MDREPAPALVRGLHLLRIIAAGPPVTLEELVRGTAIPRSSLARMLEAMGCSGVLRRDGRYWSAQVRITATEPQRTVEDWRPVMAGLVAATGLRIELWRFDDLGSELDDMAEPVDWTRQVFAYRGWRPDRHELLAPVQLWWAHVADAPAPRAWFMDGSRRSWLPASRVRRLADATRLGREASCLAMNHNRLVRYAILIRDGAGQAIGAMALVCQGRPSRGAIAALRRGVSQASR